MKKRLHYWLPLILVILLAIMQPTKTHAAAVDSGTYGENIIWTLDSNGTLTISGTGDMPDNYDLEEVESDLWRSIKASIKSVIIGEGVSSIGSDMFRFCSNLATIYIPDSVTHIGSETFFGCTSLTNVSIPKNLIDIGDKAFYNCSNLNGFWVDEENPNYSSDQYGVLFNKDKTILLKAPEALSGSYTVPDGVKILDSYYEQFDAPATAAFSNCTKLTSITLPDSVTIIGETAFANCSSLSKVNIPNNVKEIRYISFMNCTNLTSISIPGSVTAIDNFAFNGCTNLTHITLGKGIQEIYMGAFSHCTSIESIAIPDSITSIRDYAFGNCTNLTYIALGKGIQEIYEDAFLMCDKLWHVLYTGTEEEWKNINSDPEGYGNYSGNESLLSATRHYNCTGNEILDLTSKKCSICIANCNHNWGNAVVTQEVTCKEDGVKTYTCIICQKTKAESIAKLTSHTPGADATATTPQTCTVCGKELKPATGTTPPPATVPPVAEPPATVPTGTTPSATESPVIVPSATEPPTTVPSTTEPPVTVPSTTEPLTTTPTTPITSDTTESTVTPPQLEGNGNSNEDRQPSAIVIAISVLASGGIATGVILWKKKH